MAYIVEPGHPVAKALMGLGADLMVAKKAASDADHYTLMVRRALSSYDAHLFKAGFQSDGITKVATAEDTLTKAVNPQIAELTERLDQLEKMAAPGGPALRRPQASPADPKEQLADLYRHQASQLNDPLLARGYRDRADEIAKGAA